MKTVGKNDVYLPLLRVTYIFNMTGNVNLQDFTSSHTNFLDFRFQKSSDFIDFNKISVGLYEIWQQLVTPQVVSMISVNFFICLMCLAMVLF